MAAERPFQPEVAQLQQQALLQIAGRDATRVEPLNQAERPFDLGDRPGSHPGQLVERRHQVAIIVEVAEGDELLQAFFDLWHCFVERL